MRTLVVFSIFAALDALVGLVGLVGLAVPAHADPDPDAGFLASLGKNGISYHSGPDAVAAGKQVCEWIGQGQKRSDVIQSVSAGNPGFTMSGAADFTMLAERAYCPHQSGQAAAAQEPPPQQPPPAWYQIQFPIITPGAG